MSNEIITYYGKVRSPFCAPGENRPGVESNFQITTNYFNATSSPIMVKTRSGLVLRCPAVATRSPRADRREMLVQHLMYIKADQVRAARDYFVSLPDNIGPTLQLLREDFFSKYDKNTEGMRRMGDITCQVEFYFTLKDLEDHGGLFYFDELDLLFKIGNDSFMEPHPHSPIARQQAQLDEATRIQTSNGFVFWIEIIDNLGKYGDRYISVCNQVNKIVARQDKNKPDGLYIVSSRPSNGRVSSEGLQTRHFAFDDIEKELGIYQTYELAQSHGDVASTRKRELAELEHKLLVERQEALREKNRMEAENAELIQQAKRAEYERDQRQRELEEIRKRQDQLLEMERVYLREKYERRSTERKDATEMIKFLPTILAAVGTILMAYQAMKSS